MTSDLGKWMIGRVCVGVAVVLVELGGRPAGVMNGFVSALLAS
jgi:hypothetical protein